MKTYRLTVTDRVPTMGEPYTCCSASDGLSAVLAVDVRTCTPDEGYVDCRVIEITEDDSPSADRSTQDNGERERFIRDTAMRLFVGECKESTTPVGYLIDDDGTRGSIYKWAKWQATKLADVLFPKESTP